MVAQHLRHSNAFFVCLLSVASGAADTVKLRGKPAFEHVTVLDYRTDALVFRGVSREVLRKPLDEIEWFTLDDQPALSAAERSAADGRWATALAGYERALELADDPWLRTLIQLRLLAASQHAGRFDLAARLYVELLLTKPLVVSGHAPSCPGPVGSAVNALARRTLERALESEVSAAAQTALRGLLVELLIYEDAPALPAALTGDTERTGEAPASQPVESILPSLNSASEHRAPPAVISKPSLLLRMSRDALEHGDGGRAEAWLERGRPFVAAELADAWDLQLGQARLERGRYAEAAEALMALSEATTDRALAATALYYAGVAHQRMGRADVARRLYRELLTRKETPADIAQRAREVLQRLGAGGTSPP